MQPQQKTLSYRDMLAREPSKTAGHATTFSTPVTTNNSTPEQPASSTTSASTSSDVSSAGKSKSLYCECGWRQFRLRGAPVKPCARPHAAALKREEKNKEAAEAAQEMTRLMSKVVRFKIEDEDEEWMEEELDEDL